MPSLNRVTLLGHLGKDPENSYLPSGAEVANFSLATNSRWKDKNGEQQERTEWHRVVAFGKLAEIVRQHSRKGSLVYVEGRLQTRQWDDRDGNKRYTTEVVADRFFSLDRREEQVTARQPTPGTFQRPPAGPAPEVVDSGDYYPF